ncbi:MAG TPA: hypothetical protein H9683_04535 [Firmicutes bacterium]|nr:hypothetical protein [Bacillota bacterium]
MEGFGRVVKEVALAALFCTLFYLVATALAAVFVRAYAPADGAVLAVNWVIKCAGAFLFPLLFVHHGRAFFKGIAAGVAATLLAMLLFAAIGGGFRLNALFLVELLVCGALGGLGALAGVKLRKE